MKTFKILALAVLAAGIFTGCCKNCKKSSSYPFQETVWQLKQLDGKTITADNNFTVAFLSTGRVSGKGACNTFFGPWESVAGVENGIKVGMVASTMMACLNDMGNESAFFKAIEETTEYRMDEGKLYLYSGSKLRAVLEGSNKRMK